MTTLHIVLSDLDITHTTFSKITILQNKYSADVVWYLHHHQRFFDRSYFVNELASISGTLQANYQSKIEKIELKIKKYFPESNIHIVKEKYWSKKLDSTAKDLDPRVIISAKSGLSSADNQYISQNKSTLFILGQEKWLAEGKAIGAIDPFHLCVNGARWPSKKKPIYYMLFIFRHWLLNMKKKLKHYIGRKFFVLLNK